MIDKNKFEKLDRNEQRVEIAKDVIARVNAGKISPQFGKFLDVYDGGDIQEIFNTKSCSACAKGALVCSWVGNFNHYDRLDVIDSFCEDLDAEDGYPVELLEIFGREMLDDIEMLFEGSVYSWHYQYEERREKFSRVQQWPLEEIMQNIIDNGGELVF